MERYRHPSVHSSNIIIFMIWKQPKYLSTDEWIKKMWGICIISSVQFSQSLSRVRLCNPMNRSTPGLPITNSSLKLMPVKSVMPSSHLILCRPLLLQPPIPPSIRVFSNESTLHIRCKNDTRSAETILNFEFWSSSWLLICSRILSCDAEQGQQAAAPSQPRNHKGEQLTQW